MFLHGKGCGWNKTWPEWECPRHGKTSEEQAVPNSPFTGQKPSQWKWIHDLIILINKASVLISTVWEKVSVGLLHFPSAISSSSTGFRQGSSHKVHHQQSQGTVMVRHVPSTAATWLPVWCVTWASRWSQGHGALSPAYNRCCSRINQI